MRHLKIVIALFATALFITPCGAQGKYGADSAKCVSYLNFYRDSYNQKNYKEAYPLWMVARQTCPPKASGNLFIHGKKILREHIDHYTGSAEGKKILIDSLLTLNEDRAKYFPSKAQTAIEDRIGDLMYFYGLDASKSKEIYDAVVSYTERFGVAANPQQVVNGMIKAGEAYKAGNIEAEEVMTAYSKFNDIFEGKKKANPSLDISEMEAMLQNAFVGSGVASCDNLIKVFAPRFAQNKEDEALVQTIANLLSANECTDAPLFAEVVAQLYTLKPSAGSAYFLYKFFSSKGDSDEALKYLKEAVNASEGEDKGTYTYELSTIYLMKHSYALAVSAARQAAELNPKFAGRCEMIIGQVWAGSDCRGNEMDKRAKFWVATDCMIRAKQKDPSLEEEANKNIVRYRAYFPKTEDAFMFDLTDGKPYSVSCNGLSATTTVRTSK